MENIIRTEVNRLNRTSRIRFMLIFAVVFSIFMFHGWSGLKEAQAGACASIATGNWNASTTWSIGCSGPGGIPVAGDVVTIANGTTVTVTADAAASQITIAASSANTGISINAGISLNVTGLIDMFRPNAGFIATLDVGAGVLTAGSLTMRATNTPRNDILSISTGTVTINGLVTTGTTGCQFNFSGAGTLNFGNGFSNGPAALTAATGSTVNYSAVNAVIQAFSGGGYYNLTYSGAGTSTANGDITIQGNLTNAGSGSIGFSNKNITFSGTATQSIDGFTTTGQVYISGSGTQSLAGFTAGTVNMTKTAGTATFTGDVSGNGLTINGAGGTLDLGANLTHTFSGAWTMANGTLLGNSSTLYIRGNGVYSGGTFTAGTSTVNYFRNGGKQNIAPLTYYNLITSGIGTATLTGDTTVNGDLTNTDGLLDVSGKNYALSVKGNWTNTGTFDSRHGTVTFNGSGNQIINSDNTWYNLAITGGGRTVSFQSGVTQTVSNQLTFTGSAGNLLTLAPVTAGSAWLLSAPATQNVSYVNVSYSDARSGSTVNATNSTDSGNNFNWNFLPTLVTLSDFRAYNDNGHAKIEWSTSSEINTVGFYLFRLDESSGRYRQINRDLLPALLTSQQGGTYSVTDNGASSNKNNTYVLVEIEGKGARNAYGPFTVVAGGANAVETQYSSSPVDPKILLKDNTVGEPDRITQSQAIRIKRYVDSDGTIVITNSNSKSLRGAEDSVTDEVSGYTRKAKGMSVEKKARITAMKAARENAGILSKQRQGDRIKISVGKDGLYYIDSTKISLLLGISQNEARHLITAGELAISSQGSKVAYIPSSDSSGIFFYGRGIDSIYTKENIYWLYRGRGLQMSSRGGHGPSPSGYSTFTETVHAEENTSFLNTSDMDPESDYWFWGYLYVSPTYKDLASKTFTIQTDSVADIPATATLTVNLKGYTNTDANPDHHIRVSLINGTVTKVIGEGWLEGTDSQPPVVIQFDQQLLNSGSNTIMVEAVIDPGVPYSAFFVDSFDLTYHKLYEANGNALIFKAEGIAPLTVYGFTNPDIFVFDVTDPQRPIVELATTIFDEGGSFSVSFIPHSAGARDLVIKPDADVSDLNAWADTPSRLSSKINAADYVIIAPDELMEAVQVLADYRQSQGLKTMVIKLEDIMDEFNFGISSPHAIKDFLTYAYHNWSKAPRYVVLVGEGTYDYKDNQGFGDNLMPPMIVRTPFGLFPSDNILADADGDHIPDMAIGRLPVLTADELQGLVGKIITYESTVGNRIIMIADNQDEGGNYTADSDDLALLVPKGFSADKLYLPVYSADYIRNVLLYGIRSGTFLLNYIGHGNPYSMAHEGLLRIPDVSYMENAGRLFVLSAMTCTIGQFALPGYDSLSEALVIKKDGGAVAVLAPSGLSLNSLSKTLAEGFFTSAFSGTALTLGDSLREAFRYYRNKEGSDFGLDIYNLQGDPALRLVVK
jgi:hypothetical protein